MHKSTIWRVTYECEWSPDDAVNAPLGRQTDIFVLNEDSDSLTPDVADCLGFMVFCKVNPREPSEDKGSRPAKEFLEELREKIKNGDFRNSRRSKIVQVEYLGVGFS